MRAVLHVAASEFATSSPSRRRSAKGKRRLLSLARSACELGLRAGHCLFRQAISARIATSAARRRFPPRASSNKKRALERRTSVFVLISAAIYFSAPLSLQLMTAKRRANKRRKKRARQLSIQVFLLAKSAPFFELQSKTLLRCEFCRRCKAKCKPRKICFSVCV